MDSFTAELLGMQRGPSSEGLKDGRIAVGLLLHRFSNLESEVAAQVTIWKRTGLFIWNMDSERLEGEAARTSEPLKICAVANAETRTKKLSYFMDKGLDWKYVSGLLG